MASRNIAINQATLEAAVVVIIGAAVSFGLVPAADQDSVISALDGAIAASFVLVAAIRVIVAKFFLHPKVTPVADPKDNAGTPLVPATPDQLPADHDPFFDGPTDPPAAA
jgi:hypothetical protein